MRGAGLIARALDIRRADRDPATLALGSILCGYAIDSALFGLHHVICQSLVRVLRTPHAETNAAMLPVVVEALIPRAGPQMTSLARALGTSAPTCRTGSSSSPAAVAACRSSVRTATGSTKRCGRSSTGPSCV